MGGFCSQISKVAKYIHRKLRILKEEEYLKINTSITTEGFQNNKLQEFSILYQHNDIESQTPELPTNIGSSQQNLNLDSAELDQTIRKGKSNKYCNQFNTKKRNISSQNNRKESSTQNNIQSQKELSQNSYSNCENMKDFEVQQKILNDSFNHIKDNSDHLNVTSKDQFLEKEKQNIQNNECLYKTQSQNKKEILNQEMNKSIDLKSKKQELIDQKEISQIQELSTKINTTYQNINKDQEFSDNTIKSNMSCQINSNDNSKKSNILHKKELSKNSYSQNIKNLDNQQINLGDPFNDIKDTINNKNIQSKDQFLEREKSEIKNKECLNISQSQKEIENSEMNKSIDLKSNKQELIDQIEIFELNLKVGKYLKPPLLISSLSEIDITENDSYLIRKLTASFEKRRFQHSPINQDTIQLFCEEYFDCLPKNIDIDIDNENENYSLDIVYQKYCDFYEQKYIYLENLFQFCEQKFENGIFWSEYYSVQTKQFFNVYYFPNIEDFNNSMMIGALCENNKLLKSVFCESLCYDDSRQIIIEQNFDLSLQMCQNFSSEKQIIDIFMQLIDICLLLDELDLFYNQYTLNNVGVIFKEGKSIVKLRKIFTLKQDKCNYDINQDDQIVSKVFTKKQILFNEICSVFQLMDDMLKEDYIKDAISQVKILIIQNLNYKIEGIDQQDILTILNEQIPNKILEHYQLLNCFIFDERLQIKQEIYKKNYFNKEDQKGMTRLIRILKTKDEAKLMPQSQKKNQILILIQNMFINEQFYDISLNTFLSSINNIQGLSYVIYNLLIKNLRVNELEKILIELFNQFINSDNNYSICLVLDGLAFIYLNSNKYDILLNIIQNIVIKIQKRLKEFPFYLIQQIILFKFLISVVKRNINKMRYYDTKYDTYIKKYNDEWQQDIEYQQNKEKNQIIDDFFLIPITHILILRSIIQLNYDESQKRQIYSIISFNINVQCSFERIQQTYQKMYQLNEILQY